MRRATTTILTLSFFILCWMAQGYSYTLQYTDGAQKARIKWPTAVVKITLSSSLNSPPANIKEGSDVLGAVHRALQRWSEAAHIQFIEVSSNALSISPSGAGDGVSLITVADTAENRAVFDSEDRTGRTRVFYDPATGSITEADVVINPATRFSTDGTSGTYDLEATFTHELGHLLGLEHSDEAGSAMQPRQGINGLYEQTALSARTLSDDDLTGVRALYGLHEGFGTVSGRVSDAQGAPASSAHVWMEDLKSGKVVAGNVTSADGTYSIESLPPGEYRLVAQTSTALQNQIKVEANQETRQDVTIEQKAATLDPQVFGSNGHLSTIAVPVVQGRRYTIFVGGAGVDQVAGNGITVTSPFIKVNPASLTLQSGINYGHPIISFDVEVSPEAPLGDYSIRLRSKSGEFAYISGGLTVDSANGANPSAESDQSVSESPGTIRGFLAAFFAG